MSRSLSSRAAAALIACAVTGCLTTAGEDLAPLEPVPAATAALAPYGMAYRVGAFTFAQGDAEPKPSLVDGRLLATEITDAWQARSWIRDAHFAEGDEPWPGSVFYAFTFSGKQRNDSSFWMQAFNMLTLFILPYSITQTYDIECLAEDAASGAHYTATVHASDTSWVSLPLVLAYPFAYRGHEATMQNAADHLYEQLVRAGAFARETPPTQ